LGFFAALIAYTMWGFLPLYFKAIEHISPDLILAHRIAWSVPTGALLIAFARNWRDVKAALTPSRLGWLTLSAILIAANWMTYIWAVGEGRVMEASLGYYINPLVNVLIGAAFFSERLRTMQWLAVAVATIGVSVMAVALGRLPWVALFLCFSFAAYSVIRKQVPVDGRAGFLVEVLVLIVPALAWLWHSTGAGERVLGNGGWDIPLLIAAGPITALPLIFFAVAAKRLKLSTIGMMQYIGPTIQFILAIILGETFGWMHGAAFACIWTALVLFTSDSLVDNRRAKRLARAAETS
ncbi:MAG: EamA family transporter RarD, partial [Hyphomonadaceae bacterium]